MLLVLAIKAQSGTDSEEPPRYTHTHKCHNKVTALPMLILHVLSIGRL